MSDGPNGTLRKWVSSRSTVSSLVTNCTGDSFCIAKLTNEVRTESLWLSNLSCNSFFVRLSICWTDKKKSLTNGIHACEA